MFFHKDRDTLQTLLWLCAFMCFEVGVALESALKGEWDLMLSKLASLKSPTLPLMHLSLSAALINTVEPFTAGHSSELINSLCLSVVVL